LGRRVVQDGAKKTLFRELLHRPATSPICVEGDKLGSASRELLLRIHERGRRVSVHARSNEVAVCTVNPDSPSPRLYGPGDKARRLNEDWLGDIVNPH